MYVELSTLTVFLRIVLRMNSRMLIQQSREQVKLMWTIKVKVSLAAHDE